MNHKNMTLALAAIVVAIAITSLAFAIPQHVMAKGHHDHNNGSGIKVNQPVTQFNSCNNATCLNDANNTASIHR